jgi:hypothetical protein
VATYRVLYWQEVPSQVQASDGFDEVTLPLPDRFMERIDQLAGFRGLHASDDYLAGWHWSDEAERDGTPQDVAQAVRADLEATHQW